MSLDQKAQILEAAESTACSVRDIVHILRCRTSGAISLLKEMEEERLIDLRQIKNSRRGRPKKKIICTSLGSEFVETYRKLKMKPLRARKEDFEHAVKDALYTKRLIASGHSPFRLFMELNTIAHNIKIYSETSEIIRK
jgi:predicted ArsR family transcriptional regulator